MINLIIKGNMFDAFNAAHSRGIALITAAQLFNGKPNEVVASCADSSIDAVRTRYLASDDPAPYPAGALLFYSDKQSAAFNDERAVPDADEAYRVWEEACESEAIPYLAPPQHDAHYLRWLYTQGYGSHALRRLVR